MTPETVTYTLLFITGLGMGLLFGLGYCISILKESIKRLSDGKSIAAAMKQHGLELDNSGHVDADALRFMRWTGNGWFVYTTGDHKEVEVYQGDDLGRALAALIGEAQP